MSAGYEICRDAVNERWLVYYISERGRKTRPIFTSPDLRACVDYIERTRATEEYRASREPTRISIMSENPENAKRRRLSELENSIAIEHGRKGESK